MILAGAETGIERQSPMKPHPLCMWVPLINLWGAYSAGASVLCPLPHPLAVLRRARQVEEEVEVVDSAVSALVRLVLVLLMLRL